MKESIKARQRCGGSRCMTLSLSYLQYCSLGSLYLIYTNLLFKKNLVIKMDSPIKVLMGMD